MSYFILFWSTVFSAASSIVGGMYNQHAGKRQGTALLYSLMICAAATFGWGFFFLIEPDFSVKALPYALIFGGCYAIVQIFLIQALQNGPVALSSLILHFSLIITVVWGFFFWGSEFSPRVVIGLVLICLASYLCVYQKDPGERPSLKWGVCIVVALLANSGCSISQRAEQVAFDGKYGSMMMFFALSFATVICAIVFLCSRREPLGEVAKKNWIYPIGGGWMNVLLNYCVIWLATSNLSPNLIYPAISVGGLVLNILASIFLFHEKINRRQAIGFVIGGIAVVLLS